MTDFIHIRDLRLRCVIGAFPEERKAKQDVVLNVTLECDFGEAAVTDRLEDTVNYKAINKALISLVEQSEFNLIETMAERVAEACLAHDRIRQVTVTVDKPGALRFADSVAVEVFRSRAASS
jgi:dihydroneopterin aldolase/D-erythro-7,8-dihydroneopterin triphosphate epimerase